MKEDRNTSPDLTRDLAQSKPPCSEDTFSLAQGVDDTVEIAKKERFGDYEIIDEVARGGICLLYTSPSPRDATLSRMPSSA